MARKQGVCRFISSLLVICMVFSLFAPALAVETTATGRGSSVTVEEVTPPGPTSEPIPEPTASPEPTSEPTPEPTASPEPTSEPTPEPTASPEPTSEPTPEPTASAEPSPEPSLAPEEIDCAICGERHLEGQCPWDGLELLDCEMCGEKHPEGMCIFAEEALALSGNWIDNASTSWYSSSKTEFTINNANELAGVAKLVNDGTDNFAGKTIYLANDIDLGAQNWTPIGTNNSAPGDTIVTQNTFCGAFQGNAHTISNLNVSLGKTVSVGSAGLFGSLGTDGAISDLTVTVQSVVRISSTEVGAGGLVGYMVGGSTISNCHVVVLSGGLISAQVSEGAGAASAGGLVGVAWNRHSSIADCTVTIDSGSKIYAHGTAAQVNTGSFMGMTAGNTIARCSANITGTVIENYSDVNIGRFNGGFIGYAGGAIVTNCYLTMDDSSQVMDAGVSPTAGTERISLFIGFGTNRTEYFDCTTVTNCVVRSGAVAPTTLLNIDKALLGGGVDGGSYTNCLVYSSNANTKIAVANGTTTGSEKLAMTGSPISNYAAFNADSIWESGTNIPKFLWQKDKLEEEWAGVADTSWYSPTGTTFTINTAAQLAGLSQLVNSNVTFAGKTIELGADIDLSGKNWTPIGYTQGELDQPAATTYTFCGTFDGKGKTISGLDCVTINKNKGVAGLFGSISDGAVIKNLKITVTQSLAYCGYGSSAAAGLVAFVAGKAQIAQCRVTLTGRIGSYGSTGFSSAALLTSIVWNHGIIINECFAVSNTGSVVEAVNPGGANLFAGGLGGFVCNGVVTKSGAEVSGNLRVLSNQSAGARYIGGLVGCGRKSTFTDVYSIMAGTAKVEGTAPLPNALQSVAVLIGAGLEGEPVVVNRAYAYNLGKGNLVTLDPAKKASLLSDDFSMYTNAVCWTIGSDEVAKTKEYSAFRVIPSGATYTQPYTYPTIEAGFAGFDFKNAWMWTPKSSFAALSTYPVPIGTASMTDEEIVQYVSNQWLSAERILATGDIYKKLNLMTEGPFGTTIVWTSDNPTYIDGMGNVTLQPNVSVANLTATVTKGVAKATRAISATSNITLEQVSAWDNFKDLTWYDAAKTVYEIYTPQELAGLSSLINSGNTFAGKTVKVAKNLDMAGKAFIPMGTAGKGADGSAATTNTFCGTFDGQFNKIQNLNAQQTAQKASTAGLFGSVSTGFTIKNLELSVARVEARSTGNSGAITDTMAGGLVGVIAGKGLVENCKVIVMPNAGGSTISGISNYDSVSAGGLVGVAWSFGTEIKRCTVVINTGAKISTNVGSGTVPNNLGGLIGCDVGSKVTECAVYLDGELNAKHGAGNGDSTVYTGGLFGWAAGSEIKDTHVNIGKAGAIIATDERNTGPNSRLYTGGIVGNAEGATVVNAYLYNEGILKNARKSAVIEPVPGLVGGYLGSFTNCYAWSANLAYPAFSATTAPIAAQNCQLRTLRTDMWKQATYVGFDFVRTWAFEGANQLPKLGGEMLLDDQGVVDKIKETLVWETIRVNNIAPDEVRSNLYLPTAGLSGATITWATTQPSSVTTGGVVTMPASGTKAVKLTATIRKGTASTTKSFDLTVESKVVWNTFWTDYWASHDKVVWSTVGDSITCGIISRTANQRYYFDWMRERLNGEMGKHVTVVNPAVSGWNMSQFNANTQQWVNNYNADLVTVYFGMNDRSNNLATIQAELKSMVEKMLPTRENQINYGVPHDRVIVLIASNPVRDSGQDGNMRQFHDYAKQLANTYQSQGYAVQYIDLYNNYVNYPYGTNGNLPQMANYFDDSLHPNGMGQYLSAQYLMQNMGMYSADSKVANIKHTDLAVDRKPAPLANVDYNLAKLNLSGANIGAPIESSGYIKMASENKNGTMLMLGGAVTSGFTGTLERYHTYAQNIDTYLRWEDGVALRHTATIAGTESNSYTPQWFADNFEELYSRYNRPLAAIYMPEVNGLYDGTATGSATELAAYKTGLESVVSRCKEYGVSLTLLTPFPMKDSAKNEILKKYVQVILDVAVQKVVPISNLYSALAPVMTSPQGQRNWYDEAGYPNHVAHLEASKIFLNVNCSRTGSQLFGLNYKNTSTSGNQWDNFAVNYYVGKDGSGYFDLTPVLADPLYSGITTPTSSNTTLKNLTTNSSISMTFSGKKVSAASGAVVGNQLELGMKNGATTYLKAVAVAKTSLAGTVTVDGMPSEGSTLTADLSGMTPVDATVSYQWQVSDTADGTFTDISGAVQASYSVDAANTGKHFRVAVSGTEMYENTLTSPTVSGVPISATVTLSGNAVFGETLTASVTDLDPSSATVTYQWVRDGVAIPTANALTYALVAEDIGAIIGFKVTGTGGYMGESSAFMTYAVKKAPAPSGSTPAPVPELTASGRGENSITVKAVAGYEYRIAEKVVNRLKSFQPVEAYNLDSYTWNSSGEFTGLKAKTDYEVYARLMETATHEGGVESASLEVTTLYTSIAELTDVSILASVGYTDHAGKVIAVVNNGTSTITGLNVALSNSSQFAVKTALDKTTLLPGEQAVFTVAPVDGLGADVTPYVTTVTIADASGLVNSTFDMSLTVKNGPVGVVVSGTASFGAGMVPQLAALTSADGLIIDAESTVNGLYTLTRTMGQTDGKQSVTFAVTKTGESKAAISVTLVDTSAEQKTDLSGVGIKFTAASLSNKTFGFELTTVTAGTYSVVTYKKNHTTATMTGVPVGETDVALGQEMTVLAGDLNGDGKVTIIDKGLLVNAFGLKAEDADLDDNGTVAILDKGLLVNQFGKTNIVLRYAQ